MGVKIHSITISGLQGYYKPTTFKLSDGLTFIIGDNSSGKTAINRILMAYQERVSSKETLKSLLSIGLEIGYSDVVVYHEGIDEHFTVRHVVHKETTHRYGNYYEVYNSQNELVYRTEFHDETISSYMGFEVIPEPNGNFPLNFKSSKVNAFIDTSLMTNTYILEGLCHIEDYEIRIANIKEAIVKITDIKNEYRKDLKFYGDKRNSVKFLPTDKLETKLNKMNDYKSRLNLLFEWIRLVDSRLDMMYLEDNLKQINVIESIITKKEVINSLTTLESMNKVKNLVEKVDNILSQKSVIMDSRQYNYNNSNGSFLNKTEQFLGEKSILTSIDSMNKELIIDQKTRIFFDGYKNYQRSISGIRYIKELNNCNINEINIDLLNKVQLGSLELQNLRLYSKEMLIKEEENIYINKLEDILNRAYNIKKSIDSYWDLKLDIVNSILENSTNKVLNVIGIKKEMINIEDAVSVDKEITSIMKIIPVCPTCNQAMV